MPSYIPSDDADAGRSDPVEAENAPGRAPRLPRRTTELRRAILPVLPPMIPTPRIRLLASALTRAAPLGRRVASAIDEATLNDGAADIGDGWIRVEEEEEEEEEEEAPGEGCARVESRTRSQLGTRSFAASPACQVLTPHHSSVFCPG